LKDRIWICPNCGKEIKRDENSSKNIKDKYFKVGVYSVL
jgi:transposase